jgi:hypothetical protein
MNAALVYKPLRPKHSAAAPRQDAAHRAHAAQAGSPAGLPRFVQRSTAAEATPVQRDGPSAPLPPVPRYQLTPPSLLQQRPPTLLDPEYQRLLNGQLPSWLEQTLTPIYLRSRLLGNLGLPTTGAATSATPDPTVRPEGPEPAPAAPAPAAPAPASAPFSPTPPLVPSVPSSPGFGIIFDMAMAHPAFNAAVTDLKRQALGSWRSFSKGERAALISSTAVVALGSLSVLMSDPDYRAQALKLLDRTFNGQVVGIPFTPVSVEMKFEGANMMFGLHLDVGGLLPERWGFGSASPVGPNPMQELMPPLQREADGSGAAPDAGLGQRIQTAGGGRPLDAAMQHRLERRLDVALPAVQLHTDAEADQLARSVGARAFTSGAHIFFRADAHPETAGDGLRLLAHEALHTAQQATGPVAGSPAPGGVALSDPSDRFEREATTKAAQAAPTGARE